MLSINQVRRTQSANPLLRSSQTLVVSIQQASCYGATAMKPAESLTSFLRVITMDRFFALFRLYLCISAHAACTRPTEIPVDEAQRLLSTCAALTNVLPLVSISRSLYTESWAHRPYQAAGGLTRKSLQKPCASSGGDDRITAKSFLW
jgi:hypothetical protein